MYCSKCGNPLPEGSNFCMNCGESVQQPLQPGFDVPTVKKKTNLPVILTISAVCFIFLAVGVWFGSLQIAKANLHKELMRDWSRVESSDGTYYTLELDFSEDTIEYNFVGFYFEDTIATFEYEVISGNQIRIDGRNQLYTIEFNDDHSMMIISPALTYSDSSEYWFYH